MNFPLMECGHVANSLDVASRVPVCCICVGLDDGADKPRTARCLCGAARTSYPELPGFEARPGEAWDGWRCLRCR